MKKKLLDCLIDEDADDQDIFFMAVNRVDDSIECATARHLHRCTGQAR